MILLRGLGIFRRSVILIRLGFIFEAVDRCRIAEYPETLHYRGADVLLISGRALKTFRPTKADPCRDPSEEK